MNSFTNSQQGNPKTDNYTVRVLGPEDAKQVLELISRMFEAEEPLNNAYYLYSPLQKEARVQGQAKYWKLFEEHYLTNGLSVGCFDMNNGGELVAVIVCKDFTYIPKGLKEFQQKDNFMNPIANLHERLMCQLSQRYKQILFKANKGQVLDSICMAIKKEHNRKNLAVKMAFFLLKIAADSKFQYLFGFASNYKSILVFQKIRAIRIAQIDAKEFEVNGKRPFEKIEERHRYSALYLKPLMLEKPCL